MWTKNEVRCYIYIILVLFCRFPRYEEATLTPPPESCELLDYNVIPFCYTMDYNMTSYPTKNGLENQAQAFQQLNDFRPLILVNCSGASLLFLCSYYAPLCFDLGNTLLQLDPCRNLCEEVYDNCFSHFQQQNVPWPDHLNCSNFPEKNNQSLCFGPDDPSTIVVPALIPGVNAPIPGASEGSNSSTIIISSSTTTIYSPSTTSIYSPSTTSIISSSTTTTYSPSTTTSTTLIRSPPYQTKIPLPSPSGSLSLTKANVLVVTVVIMICICILLY